MKTWTMKTWQDAWDWAAAECDAWNRRDLEAIMVRYADDVALSSPLVVTRMGRADGWLHGKAEVREYFALGLQAPGLHFELVDVLFGRERHLHDVSPRNRRDGERPL
jgi:hypothetical protein